MRVRFTCSRGEEKQDDVKRCGCYVAWDRTGLVCICGWICEGAFEFEFEGLPKAVEQRAGVWPDGLDNAEKGQRGVAV